MRGLKAAASLSVPALAVAVGLAGCAGDEGHAVTVTQQGVADVLSERAEEADAVVGGGETNEASRSSEPLDDGDTPDRSAHVDVDLTTMSADMVYATVFDMVSNPAGYEGQVVRMEGPLAHLYYEPNDTDYFRVVIQDATACCAQGIEFIWGDGSRSWPDDYPEEGREVVVTGRFETYSEGSTSYVHLVDASLEVG